MDCACLCHGMPPRKQQARSSARPRRREEKGRRREGGPTKVRDSEVGCDALKDALGLGAGVLQGGPHHMPHAWGRRFGRQQQPVGTGSPLAEGPLSELAQQQLCGLSARFALPSCQWPRAPGPPQSAPAPALLKRTLSFGRIDDVPALRNLALRVQPAALEEVCMGAVARAEGARHERAS